jgi:hypothetical protein
VDEREERIGRNEAMFRTVNEKIREVGDTGTDPALSILCECGSTNCTDEIDVSVSDYERVRGDATLFLAKPGHETPDLESIVEQGDGFVIVRKRHGAPARLAEVTDPRP